jgi:hypothetical protein
MLEKLQKEIAASIEVLRRLINVVNSCEIVKKTTTKILSIDGRADLFFYIGLTSRDFWERFREHQRIHADVFGEMLHETPSFEDAALAEYTAIMLLSEPKLELKGTWNDSEGYDSASLVIAAKPAEKFVIYMLWSPKPFKPTNRTVGTLKLGSKPE